MTSADARNSERFFERGPFCADFAVRVLVVHRYRRRKNACSTKERLLRSCGRRLQQSWGAFQRFNVAFVQKTACFVTARTSWTIEITLLHLEQMLRSRGDCVDESRNSVFFIVYHWRKRARVHDVITFRSIRVCPTWGYSVTFVDPLRHAPV
jgi:hypothetical protein